MALAGQTSVSKALSQVCEYWRYFLNLSWEFQKLSLDSGASKTEIEQWQLFSFSLGFLL
jgi:hypothetical protein